MYAEKHGGGNGEDGGNVVRSIFDGANSITLPTRDKQRARANRERELRSPSQKRRPAINNDSAASAAGAG